ncbi:Eukaryotic translation initiation factor 3 subunit M [Paramyrothecium foliicola]|nr:Eukaryotic translation initiation factor 3 subunit M [Paramyrothecium foliicola]
MGNVSSRPDDGAALYLKDQNRRVFLPNLTISSLSITSPRKRSTVNIVPNAYPASRLSASRPLGEASPIEYIQDPELSSSSGTPNFLLKLTSDDELIFTFTFILRQSSQPLLPGSSSAEPQPTSTDTNISGLTFVYASTPREVENLVTREFHANPNLHKNANVELVGDYATGGSPSVTFEWTWKWKPPKGQEDKGGGWRNSCSFVEYDPRAHRLITLATFSYWVATIPFPLSNPSSPSPTFLLASPPKIRVASSQSVDSRLTAEYEEPMSPLPVPQESSINVVTSPLKEPVKVDLQCPKPGDDATVSEDGPVFRATLKALEQKTGNMRTQMKKVLKRAEQAHTAQIEANDAFGAFVEALREASSTNANAIQPALEHYFDKIAREILAYERQNVANLQRIIIDPVTKLYQLDIKQAEYKKRDFEEESKDYYAFVSRYLGQRQDSVKAKKLAESDSKYQSKRRNFELKRFDYSSFVQDLHGGRKEQEVLSHLTKYAELQTKTFLSTAKKIGDFLPQLEALSSEVLEADKEYQYQRREREEKRRLLEKSNVPYVEPEQASLSSSVPLTSNINGNASNSSDTELGRADSTGSQLKGTGPGSAGGGGVGSATELSRSPGSVGQSALASPAQGAKFKGIRDLEERDSSQTNVTQRKEGLLWSLNRPGGHVDPRNLNKQGWHKFWIVLDQGKLSEYSNWKQKLDLHMDPIDLRMASVREARNAERRFCFEVITPNYKRVYQATSEEDMNSWIVAINNALQSAMEGRPFSQKPDDGKATGETFGKRDIGSILTGKTHSLGHSAQNPHAHSSSGSGIPARRITVGARPSAVRTSSSGYDENPDKLLQTVRNNDQGNCWCADCGSGSKVEWVSINLGIILCIECSGIHRSLGTHISKVRSLTLDIKSFTIDIVELLLLIGNRVSNMVWEAKLDSEVKPGPQATREQRLRFITAKYVDRAFVEPLSPTLSRYGTADETLLAAIKRNEIQQVLYALALKANPNVTDKMRGTHAVWLALAAADPAAPSPGQVSGDADGKVVPFPVAELLVQNGAEIPAILPAFPLGRLAQLYVEQKRGRSAPTDTVPSLPYASSPNDKLQREKEARLQKRNILGELNLRASPCEYRCRTTLPAGLSRHIKVLGPEKSSWASQLWSLADGVHDITLNQTRAPSRSIPLPTSLQLPARRPIDEMAPRTEKSQLKRPRGSLPDDETDNKKPRRSERLSQAPDKTPVSHRQHLPSPVTHLTTEDSSDLYKEPTATPPRRNSDDATPRKTDEAFSQGQILSSPPQDTQPLSQYVDRHPALSEEVEDEVKEGVWGYLVPLEPKYGDKPVVLKRRSACPLPETVAKTSKGKESHSDKDKPAAIKDEEEYDNSKVKGVASGGYLIGRHPECDIVVSDGIVSNRHCLIFNENKGTDSVAIVEDLSSNGTYVNEAIVGRNQRRELEDQDEIAVHGKARFIFRYPQSRQTSGFLQQYTLLEKLGKGHFAEVYLCVEKSSGQRYAVKIFTKQPGMEERSKTEGLQQEIGVLMSVSHPNVLCLKDTFNERDRVYLVLELAAEGELFNYIVMKQKLSEDECRKLFVQLFQGIKYLHERNIVHRDIKPENILMVDKELHVKLADFGLAKIIGEESFTTTLCGTPSYVAPEILADSKQRKYTKAVDVWSLGVVLYICLCGFPPFSDELYSRDFPFTLSQQIKSGRFDYPSPYWDSVGDPALDLIDSMLVVDPERRFTIDQCLAHPWLSQSAPAVNDSTGGLVGGIAGLEVNRRAPVRERTLLSSLNSVSIAAHVQVGDHKDPVKVFAKNKNRVTNTRKEAGPASERAPAEFIEMGGKGDQELFANDDSSIYPTADTMKIKTKGK